MSGIYAHGQEKKLENEEKSKLILVTIDHHYLVVTTKHHIQLLAVKDRVLDKGVDVTHDISERGE